MNKCYLSEPLIATMGINIQAMFDMSDHFYIFLNLLVSSTIWLTLLIESILCHRQMEKNGTQ